MATRVMNHFPEKTLYKIGDENDLGTHKKESKRMNYGLFLNYANLFTLFLKNISFYYFNPFLI